MVQNLCVVLNKIVNADMVRILDERPEANHLLELFILVLQHWIRELVDMD